MNINGTPEPIRQRLSLMQKIRAHQQRCRSLPKVTDAEADRLVQQYLESHTITKCPEAYALPLESNNDFRRRVSARTR